MKRYLMLFAGIAIGSALAVLVLSFISPDVLMTKRQETRIQVERYKDSMYAETIEDLEKTNLLSIESVDNDGHPLIVKLLKPGGLTYLKEEPFGPFYTSASLPAFFANLTKSGYRCITPWELDTLVEDNPYILEEWALALWKQDLPERKSHGPAIIALGNAMLHSDGEDYTVFGYYFMTYSPGYYVRGGSSARQVKEVVKETIQARTRHKGGVDLNWPGYIAVTKL